MLDELNGMESPIWDSFSYERIETALLTKQEEILLEHMRRYQENIRYQNGFYKGFNFNNISESLQSIYVLYDANGIPLYVGESGRTRGRLKAHLDRYNTFNDVLITRIKVIPFTSNVTKKERCMVERMFINLLNPRLNELNRNRNVQRTENIELRRLENPYNVREMDKNDLETY